MTPTRGFLGDLTAQGLLGLLTAAASSGTLVFTRAGIACTLVLRGGQATKQTDLGGRFDLGATGGTFVFWPRPDADPADANSDLNGDAGSGTGSDTEPTLPSRYPAARGPLWALPALSEQRLLSTAETDLRALSVRLADEAFGGALVLAAPGACGLLLFQAGRLAGAVYEEGETLSRGDAALRALSGPAVAGAELTRYALPEGVVADFLGLLLALRLEHPAGVPDGFSGLELTAAGARYYAAGRPYLFVPRPAPTRSATPVAGGAVVTPVTVTPVPTAPVTPITGLFAPSLHTPSLSLPSEPHGWERRRYGLTLRGRDALNPLTELSMRFRGEFGRAGQRTLEQFRTEGSVEAAAAALSLDLSDLKPTVERLHTEGFLRATGDLSPTLPHRLR